MLLPEQRAGGVVYGAILVGALLAAESGHHEGYPDAIASGFITAAVFWLVHGYSTALDRRVERSERITPGVLVRALAHEWAIMRGAAIPLVALLVAWAAGASLEAAVTAAVWASIATIFVFELAAGVEAGAGGRELLLDATVGAIIGVAILGLKALLA